jgi:hypothetical protein
VTDRKTDTPRFWRLSSAVNEYLMLLQGTRRSRLVPRWAYRWARKAE